jgi:hypothetical protein
VRWESIRTITAFAAHFGWSISHMDVTTAFLNGRLQEMVYMEQPFGFIRPGQQDLVCNLNRSLYGLRQSPRAWYHRIDTDLHSWGFLKIHADSNIYFRSQ